MEPAGVEGNPEEPATELREAEHTRGSVEAAGNAGRDTGGPADTPEARGTPGAEPIPGAAETGQAKETAGKEEAGGWKGEAPRGWEGGRGACGLTPGGTDRTGETAEEVEEEWTG